MRRLLLNFLTVLSLLLCVVAVALWVRSEWVTDVLRHAPFAADADGMHSAEYAAATWCGVARLGLAWFDTPRSSMPAEQYERQLRVNRAAERHWTWHREPAKTYPASGEYFMERHGFTGWVADETRNGTRTRGAGITAPFWFIVLVFLVLPAVHAAKLARRRRRRKTNLCASCGYDLRATPGRCPECGTEAVG